MVKILCSSQMLMKSGAAARTLESGTPPLKEGNSTSYNYTESKLQDHDRFLQTSGPVGVWMKLILSIMLLHIFREIVDLPSSYNRMLQP